MGAWVTWPERPKGAKDKVKMPDGHKAGPKGRKLEVRAQWAPRLLVRKQKVQFLTLFKKREVSGVKPNFE